MTTEILTGTTPEALWLTVSPSFQGLDGRLLNYLTGNWKVARWTYSQTPDEPGSLEVALTLLHDYLKGLDRPIHLLGHGTGGLIGLLYAQQFPARVRSLGLLSVGANPAVDWQAHYYALLELLPCNRERILGHMVRLLFGDRPWPEVKDWIGLLERDLLHSPSPHSPLKRVGLCPRGILAPMIVCAGGDDIIIDSSQLQGWQPWLKQSDRLWVCPNGQYFFHANFPELVAAQILDFWGEGERKKMLATVGSKFAE